MPHHAPTTDTAEPREGEVPFAHWCYKVLDSCFPNWHTDGAAGHLLYSSPSFEANTDDKELAGWASAKQSCKLWLDSHRPEWENPFAYWLTEEKP